MDGIIPRMLGGRSHLPAAMRIPDWTPEAKPQPQDLIDAILARRGGQFINLDRALLWSEPLARGWNAFFQEVRTGMPTDRRLRELAICTVALLTGARYEYHHHAPDFLRAAGQQSELDALALFAQDPKAPFHDARLGEIETLVVRYAAQMTLDVRVDDALFDALCKHFNTTELVELTISIASYNMVARFLVAMGVTPEGG